MRSASQRDLNTSVARNEEKHKNISTAFRLVSFQFSDEWIVRALASQVDFMDFNGNIY